MHRMLADLASLGIDDEAALAVAEAVQADLDALADRDVLQPDAVDEIDHLLLRRRRRGLREIPLDPLHRLLGPQGHVVKDRQVAAWIDLEAPVRPQQPAAEFPRVRGGLRPCGLAPRTP